MHEPLGNYSDASELTASSAKAWTAYSISVGGAQARDNLEGIRDFTWTNLPPTVARQKMLFMQNAYRRRLSQGLTCRELSLR